MSGKYTFSTRDYPTPRAIFAVLGDFSGRMIAYPDLDTETRVNELIDHNELAVADVAGDLLLFLRNPASAIDLVSVADESDSSAASRGIEFDRRVSFLGAEVAPAVEQGLGLPFTTRWSWRAPTDRLYLVQWLVLDASGKPVRSQMRYLGYLLTRTPTRENYLLPIPESLSPRPLHARDATGMAAAGSDRSAGTDDPGSRARGGRPNRRVRRHRAVTAKGSQPVR